MTDDAQPIFVEEWSPSYGSPYLVGPDRDDPEEVALVEDGDAFVVHPGTGERAPGETLAFVDGVRRGEASLYRLGDDGSIHRGVAGAHACGAVLCRLGSRAEFAQIQVSRLVIWGGGQAAPLVAGRGGFAWEPRSIASDDPDAPILALQDRMRRTEGELAEQLAGHGHLVVVDGGLTYVRSLDLPVVGYVKTHHRALLPAHLHAQVPRLGAGQRSSIFALGADRYSAYLRLAEPRLIAGPWSGIVRLEVPQSAGLDEAQRVVGRLASILPAFAGVAHCDPRAPQNLQPVGALEARLRHLLGDPGLASRAVREAVLAAHRSAAA